jgi:broad specificity phosphatase PhoE
VTHDPGDGAQPHSDDGRAAEKGRLTGGGAGVADAPRIVLAARRDGPAALWLIRHGQSEGNVIRDEAEQRHAQEYVLGSRDADVPLSDLGREQAEAFGRWLAEQPRELHPDVVLVSPYLRAAQTADIVLETAGLQDLPRGVDERLRDREMGVWDGLTWRGIVARYPEEAERAKLVGRFFHRPAGGESWADICLRLRSLLADVAHELSGRRVLVVAHDVIIQLTRVLLDGMSEADAVELVTSTTYANCALTTLEQDDHGLGLDRYNWTVPVREQGEPATRSADAPAGR